MVFEGKMLEVEDGIPMTSMIDGLERGSLVTEESGAAIKDMLC